MEELRYNSAVTVHVGQFVDRNSGVTAETGLTLGGMDDCGIIKKESATTIGIQANNWAHVDSGYYQLGLTATDTDTTGPLTVFFRQEADTLGVWHKYNIVGQNYYDSKYDDGDKLDYIDVNVVQIGGAAIGSSGVTVVSNSDKAGYAVTSGVTLLGGVTINGTISDLDTLENSSVTEIWAYSTGVRSLTSGVTLLGGVTINGALNDLDSLNNLADSEVWGYATRSIISGVTIEGTINDLDTLQNSSVTEIWTYSTGVRALTSGVTLIGGVTINGTITDLDGLENISATEVNAEVVDVLTKDTFPEPVQGALSATTTIIGKLGYVYKFLRNKITNDGVTTKIFNDDTTTIDHWAVVSESGGTVTRNEFTTGAGA